MMIAMKILSILVAAISIGVGLLFSPIPGNLGLYRWIASKNPAFIGLSPAFHRGVAWKYTFEELYRNELKGQTAVVTGANSGMGYETSLALGRLGASVTLACRNAGKCEAAAATILSDPRYGGGKIATMTLDTSSLRSVQAFAQEYIKNHDGEESSIDMLYLNAGMVGTSKDDGSLPLSEDGIELTFATNYLGHHLLYTLLEPLVLKSSMARVVVTSSGASFGTSLPYNVATSLEILNNASHKKDWNELYNRSKLAQILWVKELTRRLGNKSNVYANAANPGAVDTPIWIKNPLIPQFLQRTLILWWRRNAFWTAEQGALTMLYLGVATDQLARDNVRGKYFHPQAQEVVNPLAMDQLLQEKLWNFSGNLVSKFVAW